MENPPYACSVCGKLHPVADLSFATDFPDSYVNMSKDARDARALIGSDQCVIDQAQFYLRGCIELPVRESEGSFLWGVWARVHEVDFDEFAEYWETERREEMIGPYKGRLANSLSIYPETPNMKLEIQIQPVGSRPLFFLEDQDHPMTIEQRTGLSMEKAKEYACLLFRMEKL